MKKKVEPIKIISAKYLGEHKIKFLFNDKKTKTVNFQPFLASSHNPHINKYLNKLLFKQFTLKNGDIHWNDFDLCFPIYDLYQGSLIKENHPIIKKSA